MTTEEALIKLAESRVAGSLLEALARLAGVERPSARWRNRSGPTFENSIGIVELDGRRAEAVIYRAESGDDARSLQPLHTCVLAHGPRDAHA